MPVIFEHPKLSSQDFTTVKRKGNFLGNECSNAEVRATYAHLLLREYITEDFIEVIKSPLGYNLLLKERLLSFFLSYKNNDLYRTLEYIFIMSERERKKFKIHNHNVALNYGSSDYPYFTLSVDFAIFVMKEVRVLKEYLLKNKLESTALSVYQEDLLYGNTIFGTPYTRDGSNLKYYFEQVKHNMARRDVYPEAARPTKDEENVNVEFYRMLGSLDTMGEDLNTYIGYLSAGINLPSIDKTHAEEILLVDAWEKLFNNFGIFYSTRIEPFMGEYTF